MTNEADTPPRRSIASTLLGPLLEYFTGLWSLSLRGWDRYWFTPVDPVGVAFVRICTGLVLLYVYGTCLGDVDTFIGPHAWVDASAIRQLRSPDLLAEVSSNRVLFDQSRALHRWYGPSVYLLTENLAVIRLLYGAFLAAMLCLTIGLWSRAAAVLSWVGHLSFVHRGYVAWFGMDCVLAMLGLYLLFAPSGAAWSVDAVLRRAHRLRSVLSTGAARPGEAPEASVSANVVIRLIQVNMCLIYFCSGCAKLQGSSWWSGQAVWFTLMIPELRLVDVSWLAYVPWLPEVMSSVGVALTVVFEGGFPFFVHQKTLRPLVLTTGVVLHAGIGLFMGLGSFGAAMLTGLASFLAPSRLRWAAAVACKGPVGYRFTYDAREPSEVDLASFVSAVNPWNQVEVVDSAHVPRGATGATLIAPDGALLNGVASFLRLVRVLRPLWILWPLMVWKLARRGSSHPA